jgi:hypothetical protein
MGGNAFKSMTDPIHIDQVSLLLKSVIPILTENGVTKVTLVGSAGKKETSGDVDLAIEFPGTRDDLYNRLCVEYDARFGLSGIRKYGSGQISIMHPWNEKYVQLDLIIGDTKWLEWALFSPHPDECVVGGEPRNILLNDFLCDNAQYASGARSYFKSDDRTRMLIDWNVGLFFAKQTNKTSDPSRMLVTWKTLDKLLITNDPDELVKSVFGVEFSVSDTKTFDGLVKTIKLTHKDSSVFLKRFADTIKMLIDNKAINLTTRELTHIIEICT